MTRKASGESMRICLTGRESPAQPSEARPRLGANRWSLRPFSPARGPLTTGENSCRPTFDRAIFQANSSPLPVGSGVGPASSLTVSPPVRQTRDLRRALAGMVITRSAKSRLVTLADASTPMARRPPARAKARNRG